MLIGGIGLVFLLAFLVVLTVPNLRRKVAPPEISGPGQVERNRNASASSTGAISGTQAVTASDSTSGTHPILNLDDYPHLSPKMRELTQSWLDRCAETDKTLETITDPVLRAQILGFLKERRRIHSFLNVPLKWDELTLLDWGKCLAYSEIPNPAIPTIEGYGDWNQLLDTYPEFGKAFEEERSWASVLGERMQFEFEVHGERWDTAAFYCVRGDSYSHVNAPFLQEWGELSNWEEEVYCLRQMGAPGLACLAGRSYQRALDSRREGQPPANQFQYWVRTSGYLPIYVTVAFKNRLGLKDKNEQDSRD